MGNKPEGLIRKAEEEEEEYIKILHEMRNFKYYLIASRDTDYIVN
jgi:hypothetical protein